jgi:hypothetical protein
MTTVIERPEPGEYVEYYQQYISKVPPGDVLAALEGQIGATRRLLIGLSEQQAMSRYAPGKWSVKEVVGHLSDSERVMSHRALRFARGDRTPLPGFDENQYVPAGAFDARPLTSLVDEFAAVRAASLALFTSLDAAASRRQGEANGHPISVRALAYIIAGHELHHVALLRERYKIGG